VPPRGVRAVPQVPGSPPVAYRVAPAPALAPNGQPLASFTDRLGAYLLDRLLISAVLLLPGLVLGLILLVPPLLDDVRAREQAFDGPGPSPVHLFARYLLLFVILFLLQCVVTYCYEVLYQTRNGQTIGKRALGIRTQALDGAALTRRAATVRWLVTLGGVVVPGFSYLDGLWQLWDRPLQQCLHDKAAQTVVVKV
jgi:uncharacterized RDD family membrane protein YckC